MEVRIEVSSLEQERPRLPSEIKEGGSVEFKSSLFFAPSQDRRQVETIARTIAAFMNSNGGFLYLGVKDDGTICGIDEDLQALRSCVDETRVNGAGLDSSEWDYSSGTIDKYSLKISHIVRSYLGTNASAFISDPEVIEVNGYKYVRVDVRPSVDALIYLRKRGDRRVYLYCRRQSEVVELKGVGRDEFVAARIRASYEDNRKILMLALSGSETEKERLQKEVDTLSKQVGLLRSDSALVETSRSAELPKSKDAIAAQKSGDTTVTTKWFQKADGSIVNPDDIMAPKNRRAVAKAYREGRLKSSEDIVFKYMSCLMRQEMSKKDTLDFLYFIWKNEE